MEATSTTVPSTQSYLVFKLGNEKFALEVQNTESILKLTELTKVPNAPVYLRGVLNLSGQALPVIDLNYKLSGKLTEYTENTCLLVTQTRNGSRYIRLGFLVDDVEEVTEIDAKDIIQADTLAINLSSRYLKGIIEDEQKFIMLMDVEQLFNTSDVNIILNQVITEEVN